MADNRLQWRQLSQAQPNTAGYLQVMQRGINDAASAAEGVLGRYQEGQEVVGDQELARLLASATNQEELDTLVNSDAVRGLSLSKDGVGMLNAAQGNRVDWDNTRSVMNDRKGRLGVAQGHLGIARDANTRAGDLHGISMEDHRWRQGVRSENANLSGAVVAARDEAQKFGTYGAPQGSALDNYLKSTINSESSGDTYAENENSTALGLAQFLKGTWAQMMAKHPDLGLTADGRTDPAQAKRALRRFTEDNMKFLNSAGIPINEGTLYQAHFLGNGGAHAVARASDSTMMRDIISTKAMRDNPVLASMDKASFERWAMKKGGGNAPAGSRTPARDALESAVADSKYLSLGQIDKILDGNDASVNQGDKEIASNLAKEQEDILASIIIDRVEDPDIHTTNALIESVLGTAKESGRFTDKELLDARSNIRGTIDGHDSLKDRMNPTLLEDIRTNDMIGTTMQREKQEFYATQTNRLLKEIPNYTEDPTGSLENALGIPTDGETRGDYDSEKLRHLINRLAGEHSVEPSVMAAAMREAFIRDPGDDGQHWWDVDWTRNTMARRFDQDIINKTIQQITPKSRNVYQEGKTNLAIMEQQMKQVAAQRNVLRKTMAKLPADSPRRSAIEAQLVALDAQFAAIESNREVRP